MSTRLAKRMSISHWPRRGDFVVMDFDRHAGFDQLEDDLRAEVLQGVGRRDREVAFLPARAVAQVGRAALRPLFQMPSFGVDRVHRAVLVLLEAHAVEDEELGLGAPVGRRRRCRSAQVGLGLEGDAARVAAVGLAGQRIEHVAGQAQGGHLADRVNNGGGRDRA